MAFIDLRNAVPTTWIGVHFTLLLINLTCGKLINLLRSTARQFTVLAANLRKLLVRLRGRNLPTVILKETQDMEVAGDGVVLKTHVLGNELMRTRSNTVKAMELASVAQRSIECVLVLDVVTIPTKYGWNQK